MNQEDLIQMAKAGDREAIINLLKSVESAVYKTAFYYMGNEHDAKDAAQDALIRIYTKIDTFQERAKFSTWAQRITANICMDKFRKKKNEISIDGAELTVQEDFNLEQAIENKLMIKELNELILVLPENLRATMILRYFHEFSYQEISEALSLPLNTVKSYLFRAREQLQKHYQQGGVHL